MGVLILKKKNRGALIMDVSTYVLKKERRDETIQYMMLTTSVAASPGSQYVGPPQKPVPVPTIKGKKGIGNLVQDDKQDVMYASVQYDKAYDDRTIGRKTGEFFNKIREGNYSGAFCNKYYTGQTRDERRVEGGHATRRGNGHAKINSIKREEGQAKSGWNLPFSKSPFRKGDYSRIDEPEPEPAKKSTNIFANFSKYLSSN